MEIKIYIILHKELMGAQLVRLNAIASNLSQCRQYCRYPSRYAYKPVKPVFETKYFDLIRKKGISTVDAVTVEKMDIDPIKQYKPDIQWRTKTVLYTKLL